jgi:IS1 family transposase
MANVMKPELQQQIVHLLVEGNSIRSIERLTGAHRDSIVRLMVKVGEKCRTFLDNRLRGLKLRHIQSDEIWTFCRKRQAGLRGTEKFNPTIGDQFLYIAFDQSTKLIACYALGKRTSDVTNAFMDDLASRIVTDVPQISTDGFNAYPHAIKEAFGEENVNYGQIIKDLAEPVQPGRYGPPVMVASERRQILGLDNINLRTICTSHVERNNLSIRTFMRRFTRLSLGFSKKLENLAAATALHVAFYNFCRVHGTLRTTPAMAAGVTDHVWELDELLAAI